MIFEIRVLLEQFLNDLFPLRESLISQSSLVVLHYGLDDRGLISGGGKDCSPVPCVRTGCGSLVSSGGLGYWASLLRG
jgi:hypothetical protein